MTDEIRARGMKIRRKTLGDAHVDKSIKENDAFTAPFRDLVNRYCWGEVWAREGLAPKTRSMINIAMLTALNRPHEIRTHLIGALNNGVTKDEIAEILMQSAIYCGVPAAVDSFRIAREVFRERGI